MTDKFSNIQLKHFDSLQDANEQADKQILQILDDRNNLNPDKFQQIIESFEKKQIDLDNEISISLRNQIDGINQTKTFIQDSLQNQSKIQTEIQKLNDYWYQDNEFHQEMELYEQVGLYKKNIYQFVDELKYFLDVTFQIERMEEQFQQENYEYIFFKLLALTQLRDNVLCKMETNSKDFQKIKEEFNELDQFEKKFYEQLYGKISDCIDLAKTNPEQLIGIVKIIRNGDKLLTEQGKKPIFKDKAIQSIQVYVNKKFEERLNGITQTQEILDKAKFIVYDLIQVSEHVANKFPEDYDIFGIFETCYKYNIENKMMPIIEEEVEVKKEYGSLVYLMNWVEKFENVLARAGRQEVEYAILKAKISVYMEPFMNHLRQLFTQYAQRAIEMDKQDSFSYKSLQQMIKDKKKLESLYPEDIFKFLNDQISLIASQLKGQSYRQYIETIINSFIDIIDDESKWVEKIFNNNIDDAKENEDVQYDLTFKLCLVINNYQRCQKYALETKNYAITLTNNDDLIQRIEGYFKNLGLFFRNLIHQIYQLLNKIAFVEIENIYLTMFFQQEWVDNNIMKICIEKLTDFFDILKVSICLESHLWAVEKQCFSYLQDMYFEYLIIQYKLFFPKNTIEYTPIILKQLLIDQELQNKTSKKDKKEKKEKDSQQIELLSNQQIILENISRDYQEYINECKQNYQNDIGSTQVEIYDKIFTLFIDLIKVPKIQLENEIINIIKIFQLKSIPIFEITLSIIRKDCDNNYKKDLEQKFNDSLPKYLNKEYLLNQ